jgi:hypothetical protein
VILPPLLQAAGTGAAADTRASRDKLQEQGQAGAEQVIQLQSQQEMVLKSNECNSRVMVLVKGSNCTACSRNHTSIRHTQP